MKKPRMTRSVVAGLGAVLALTGVLVARHRSHDASSFPGSGGSPHSLFQAALRRAQTQARNLPNDPETWRVLGRLYQANGHLLEAKECFLSITKNGSTLSAVDHYYLADIAQGQGDLVAAQSELRVVTGLEPRYLPARVALAETFFKSGQEDEAAQQYAAVTAQEPAHPQATIGLARIALQRGDDATAISLLERLMVSHPESTSGAALLAQISNRRGDTARADTLTQWSRQLNEPVPSDPWRDTLLAECYDSQRLALKFEEYSRTGQFDDAAPLLDRVEELDPTSPIPQILRAWPLARSQHYREAEAEYQKALEKGAYPEKVGPLLVSTLLADGKGAEATHLIAGYYAKMPDSIPILTSYAEAAVKSGDDKTARVLLSKVLEKQPFSYAPNMSLAKILWESGERDDAVKCLQRIVSVFAVDVPSRGLLGQYFLEKSDPSSAIPLLEQAVAQQTSSTTDKERLIAMLDAAYLKAGIAEVERQRFSEATAYYDKAIALKPADLRGYACQASVYVHLKQFRAATQCLEKMAALEPKNPTIYISLGDALYQDGKRQDAKRTWQMALALTETSDADLQRDLKNRINGKITADTFK